MFDYLKNSQDQIDITKFMNAFKSLRRHAQINLPPTPKKIKAILLKKKKKEMKEIDKHYFYQYKYHLKF